MRALVFVAVCLLLPTCMFGQPGYYKEILLHKALDSLFPDIKIIKKTYGIAYVDSISLPKTDTILTLINKKYPDLAGLYSMISANGFLDQNNYPEALKYYDKAIISFESQANSYNLSACFKAEGDIFLHLAKGRQPICLDIVWFRDSVETRHGIVEFSRNNALKTAIDYYNRAYRYFTMWRSEDKMPGLGIFVNESELLFKKSEAYRILAGRDYSSRHEGTLVDAIDEAYEAEYKYNDAQESGNISNKQKALALQNQMRLNALKYEYEKKQGLARSDKERQKLKYEEELKRKQLAYDYASVLAEREKKDFLTKAAQDKEKAKQRQQQELAQSNLRQQRLYSIIAFVGLCLLASVLIFRNRLQRLKLRNELQKEKADMQLKEAEYKSRMNDITFTALRAQMNPHFIFNCLNSIKLYTEQNNTEAASQYLTKFSKLIRNMLDSGRTESITLSQELESLRLYLDMEAMRFKQKLQYNIHIDKDIDEEFIEIPPLLIQPYVENAIWHGLMHKAEGGTIGIDISQSADHSLLIIAITDDGVGREKAASIKSKTAVQHKSYGTKVTGERIALINEKYKAGAEAVIMDLYDAVNQPAGTLVTIKLPIR